VVRLAGGSDARVAGGFLALLVRGLDGASPADVLAVSIEAVAEAAGLKVSAAPSRVVGLGTMLHTLQDRVRAAVAGQLVGGCGVGGDAAAACGVEMPRYANVHCGDVAVLLSGGVDSGVAMRLAQESGHRVHPFYLKIWLEDELAHLGDCPWEEDIAWASAVCAQAGVELETVSMQREYWDRVVSYTIDEARAGRTPNPDIMCNTRVKFGAFYDAVGRHFPTIVTGHYAQKAVCAETGLAELRMSPDLVKDQTYFLANLRQEQLSRAEFPVGALEKQRVRELANEYLLPNRARKDSQGICFLGKLKFDDFLGHHLGTRRGPIVEYETGLALGEHRGFWFYTAGQRKGIGLSGGPWHVVSKDPDANIVFVSRQYRDVAAARTSFEFESASWIAGSWPPELRANGCRASLLVKTRHGPTITECTVTRTGLSSGHVDLGLRDSAQALAPGQFAVLYTRGGVCLGTGRIGSDVRVRENAHALSGVTTSVNLQAHYL
jgi:tRNA (5-methylaminomethyl-2-thiouridylate)-methyltransferase